MMIRLAKSTIEHYASDWLPYSLRVELLAGKMGVCQCTYCCHTGVAGLTWENFHSNLHHLQNLCLWVCFYGKPPCPVYLVFFFGVQKSSRQAPGTEDEAARHVLQQAATVLGKRPVQTDKCHSMQPQAMTKLSISANATQVGQDRLRAGAAGTSHGQLSIFNLLQQA